MRLAIATQQYDIHTSGQGAFAVHLAQGLAAAGHDVLVLVPSAKAMTSPCNVVDGPLVQEIPALPLLFIAPQVHVTPFPSPAVRRVLDEFHPEVVHIQDHYPLCRRVARETCKRGIPMAATNHFLPDNIIDEVAFFRHIPQLLTPMLWKQAIEILELADVVTSPTETGAQVLRAQKLSPPVRAISCGVDLRRFRPDPSWDRDEMRERYGLDPERMLFLYVGRVEGEKRLDVLIQALQLLDRDDVQLAIAGRGAQRKELEEMGHNLVEMDDIVFTGFVPDEDLPGLLHSSDIFCMPSDAELQSIATLEAMGTGRPILASDACALPELVHNGVNGYLFEHGNAEDAARCMALLIEQRSDWPAMGAASLEIVRPHDMPNTIRQYEALYRSLVEDKSP